MSNYKTVIDTILTPGKSNIKVACMKDDPDTIIGYSLLSADFQTIFWVYVKKDWRQHGIGWSLIPRYATAVTHLTKIGETLLKKLPSTIYNPFRY